MASSEQVNFVLKKVSTHVALVMSQNCDQVHPVSPDHPLNLSITVLEFASARFAYLNRI